jgi:transposase
MIVMRLNNQTKEKSPMNTITAGVDLAKLVFSICMVDAFGHVLQRKDLKRAEFAAWLAQVPAGTVIAMEACSGAHHWGRRCLEYGLVPRLMAPKLVKPYRKSQKTKNDRNDAEAIATAARQGNMRFVALKLIDQQARLSWHRVREGYKTEGLAISNRLRGLQAEFGVIVGKGDRALREMLGDTKAMAALPVMLVEALDDLNQHWQRVCDRLAACSKRIEVHANADERCKRMRMLIGIGPITADAIVATVGSACEFRNGRQLAAWLGIVPSQNSTGGHDRLGEISCDGDPYLRTLLIQGARSSLHRAKAVSRDKATHEQLWIMDLAARKPFGKVLVAIANKHARQLWVILARGEHYDPDAWLRHPMHQRSANRPTTTTA